jgi:hypothetical protein
MVNNCIFRHAVTICSQLINILLFINVLFNTNEESKKGKGRQRRENSKKEGKNKEKKQERQKT